MTWHTSSKRGLGSLLKRSEASLRQSSGMGSNVTGKRSGLGGPKLLVFYSTHASLPSCLSYLSIAVSPPWNLLSLVPSLTKLGGFTWSARASAATQKGSISGKKPCFRTPWLSLPTFGLFREGLKS